MTILQPDLRKEPLRYRLRAFLAKPANLILLFFLAALIVLSLMPMATMPPIDAPNTHASARPNVRMAPAVSRDMSRTAYPGGRSLRGSNSHTVKSSVNGLYAAATASADASTLCTESPGRITKGRGPSPNRTQSISKASVLTV